MGSSVTHNVVLTSSDQVCNCSGPILHGTSCEIPMNMEFSHIICHSEVCSPF